MRHRIRCGVLVVCDNRVLMFKGHNSDMGEHWGPPAGGLDGVESIYECARREFYEETGARVSGLTLAYVNQFTTSDVNQVNFFFLANELQGTPTVQGEWGAENEYIQDLVWLGENELAGKNVLPPFLIDRLFDDLRDGIKSPIYIRRTRVHPD